MASVLSNASRKSSLLANVIHKRLVHQTSVRHAITKFQMPAMSPTMTEGGIASWKKAEGEAFTAGDVLLEIETDKATIDVEAQDDGVLGKIPVADGAKNVPVGKTIALLAEEGDDISNIQIPAEEPSQPAPKQQEASPAPPPAAAPKPSSSTEPASAHAHGPLPPHSAPLFPSVHRLIVESNIQNLDAIKGTGVRGMLTKGDVLAFLGKASGPNGTFKPSPSPIEEALKSLSKKPAQVQQPLDGDAIRRLIVTSMLQTSLKASNPPPDFKDADFDSVISDYLPTPKPAKVVPPPAPSAPKKEAFLEGLY